MSEQYGTCGHLIEGKAIPITIKGETRDCRPCLDVVVYCDACRAAAMEDGDVLETEEAAEAWLRDTSERKTYRVRPDGNEHEIGNKKCGVEWCGSGYPRPCDCGGLIHADFGDENYDGDYWLYTKCDMCGERGNW